MFNLCIIDLVIIIVFIVYFIFGLKKGITKSAVSFLFALISIFFSSFFASYLSKFLFNSFIKENMLINISNALKNTVDQDILLRSNAVLSTFPDPILKLFSYYGITSDTINTSIYGTTEQATLIIMNMLSPIILDLIRIISFLVLSTILSLIIKPFKISLIRFAKLPVINVIDSALGGAFGLLKCILIILVFCTIINLVVPMSDDLANVFNEQSIKSTYLFKYIYYNNPIINILNSL